MRRLLRFALGAEGALFLGIVLSLAASFFLAAGSPENLVKDAAGYDHLAFSLASGHGFRMDPNGPPEIVRTPGFPLLLAALFTVFGHRLVPYYFVSALLHGGTVFFSARIAERVLAGRSRLAQAAPFAVAAYPYLLYATTRVLTETLTAFLLALAIDRVTLALTEAPRARDGWIAGLAFGALSVTRPNFLFLPMIIAAVVLFFRWTSAPRRHALALVIGTLIFAVPWSVRTSLLTKELALVGGAGFGNALLIGTWEYRDLSYGIPETTDFERWPGFMESEQRALDSVALRRGTPPAVAAFDHAQVKEALARIEAEPWLYLRATLIRTVKLWVSQYHPGLPGWLKTSSTYASLLILMLGALGVFRLWPLSPSGWLCLLPILYLTLTLAPLHAEARYTLAARPMLLVFAAAACTRRSRGPQ